MFGRKKQKDDGLEAIKTVVADRMTVGGLAIRRHIEAQVAFAVDHFQTDPHDAWHDAYTRFYIFGAFDSLFNDFPLEIREMMAPSMIELSFVNIAIHLFERTEEQAKREFQQTLALHNKSPTYAATIDGGYEGLNVRQGKPAMKLLGNFFEAYENPE